MILFIMVEWLLWQGRISMSDSSTGCEAKRVDLTGGSGLPFAGIFINTIGGRIVMRFMWMVVGVVFTVNMAGSDAFAHESLDTTTKKPDGAGGR
jgi:hypothetical protein